MAEIEKTFLYCSELPRKEKGFDIFASNRIIYSEARILPKE